MLNKILGLLLVVTMALTSFWAFNPSAYGSENQTNQGGDRLATLKSPSPNFEISLYPRPDSHVDRLGFGLSGDEVTILEQMSSNKKFSWYRVRFNNPPYVEGWMQGNYLVFINQYKMSVPNIPDKNRYLGNHTSSANPQGNRQGNSNQYNNYPQKQSY